MPPKGYVNVGTSMKIQDAEVLREKLAQLGFDSLRSLLRAIVSDETQALTGKLTSRTENESSKLNGGIIPKAGNAHRWWAGRDLNSRPSACQADVLTKLDDRPNRS